MAYQNTRERELDGLSAAQEEKVAKVLSEVNKAISDRVNKAYSDIAKAISAPPMLNFKIDLPLFGPPKHLAAFARLQSIAANSIRKPLEDLQQQIDKRIRAVSIDFDILGPKWKSAVLTLAYRGWYIDGDLSPGSAMKLAKESETLDQDKVDEVFVDYYRGRIDKIEEALTNAFPTRKSLIIEAFNAHKLGMYACSITLLLTQVDGICVEVTSSELFMRDRKTQKPKTQKFLEQNVTDIFLRTHLVVLEEASPIMHSQNERDANFKLLNRHTVLHGESTDFANETNSLRVISLLSYLETFLGFVVKRNQRSA